MLNVANPGFYEALEVLKKQIFSRLNCVQIARIEKYDPSAQTVEASIVMKAVKNGDEIVEYPLLIDVPVFVLQGGGAYLDMPISPGDFCIILFNDRDIDTWWLSGNVKQPATKRKHNIADGLAIVGINPATNTLSLDGSVVRLLGASGEGSEEFAARVGDDVRVTIPAGTFVVEVTGGAGAPAVGVKNPLPIDVDGTIISGSGEVKIG